jgi:serine/threonine protein kinase
MESRDDIFLKARAIADTAEQAAYLNTACEGNAELRQRVEAMLRDAEKADDFFGPAGTVTLNPLPLTEAPGSVIGKYKLLQKIGEGGMGVVYMAEQRELVVRKVALKIVKLGMDTRQVVGRFEAERQALALMDHPNIAKVLEAGATETGRPFFVMELVRGIKITDYCDQNNLPTQQRLDLFLQVCKAVQHAHQKGIIHRDIKPSNILVADHDGVPVPKIIDFGIAKATTDQRLTDKTVFTAFEQFIGTPVYMSPEQAKFSGLDIDTRTDIYSLGVLLYELLTGKTPFDEKRLLAAGLEEMRRTIREAEPARPSTALSTMHEGELSTTAKHRQTDAPKLVHLIRGDLDWIVMKCLEKDRSRRYETASGLASDVQRHLHNEPIVARPPSQLYRFGKLVRRNKLAFTAAGAVAIVLVFGIVASTWQAVRATRAEREQRRLREGAQQAQANEERLRAQADAARARAEADEKKAETAAARSAQVAQFMKDMLAAAGPNVARGRDATLLREILDNTAKRLDKDLARQPEVAADMYETLGIIYRDLGQLTNAVAMFESALNRYKELYGDEDPHVASVLDGLGQALHRQSLHLEAETAYRRALSIQERSAQPESLKLAAIYQNLGSLLRSKPSDAAKLEEAEKLLRRALEIRKRILPAEHPDIASALSSLGMLLDAQNRLEEAERYPFEKPWRCARNCFLRTIPNLLRRMATWAACFETRATLRRRKPI